MKRTPLLAFALMLCCFNVSAQSNNPLQKSLLWRISGNGLTKPSYLYGTLHLQDKRVFNFSDSLFRSIEQTEGLAIELNIHELMDSIIQYALSQREGELMDKNLSKSVNKGKYIDSLINNVKKDNDPESRKRLKKLREEKMRSATNNEMPTFMDAYLFGIAHRLGKWTGGIEDVQDQMPLLDEMGKKITKEELMAPVSEIKKQLDEMIQLYLSQDIVKIEQFCREDLDGAIDPMMVKRNIKMSYRMDSLARIRTMFFAVGAAHLAGEKGVIQLLREKGFNVEPVLSKTKIDAQQYVSKLDDASWVNVTDTANTYTVQMPGAASDLKMWNELVNMKFYVDITSLTYYMSASIPSQRNVDLNKVIEAMAKNTESGVSDLRKFDINGAKAIEAVFAKDGYHFKVQYLHKGNFIFMLLAGGEKKEILKSKDADRFFRSFVAKEKIFKENKEWQSFQVDDKAFKINTPSRPKNNKAIDKAAQNSEWIVRSYDCYDTLAGIYYLVQVKDLSSGYYLTGDSAYFDLLKASLAARFDTLTLYEVGQWKSFPALKLDGRMNENNIYCQTININRGNRIYTLMAVGEGDAGSNEGPQRFFNSFEFTDYKKPEWKTYRGPNFSSSVPSEFQPVVQNDAISEAIIDTAVVAQEGVKDEIRPEIAAETEAREIQQYNSYDPNSASTYYVIKYPNGAYFWVKDENSYFENLKRQFVTDSIINEKQVKNGTVSGREYLTILPDNNLRKRIRFLLHGDTTYALYCFTPSQYVGLNEDSKFFDDFRFDDEKVKSTIYENKYHRLMRDLLSNDSTIFADAMKGLEDADFQKEDIPFLVEGLTNRYRLDDDENTYRHPRDIIGRKLEILADSSMVSLIDKHFKEMKGDKEVVKIDMLNTLAAYHTDYSYKTLKNLILNYTPKQTLSSQFFSYRIDDSVELAAKLYPDILRLSRDTIFGRRIWQMTRTLLDSSMIKREIVLPYKDNLLFFVDRMLEAAKDTANFFGYSYQDQIYMLGIFNDEDCNKKLQQILQLKDPECKQQAILALLKNGKSVPVKDITILVENKNYRLSMYEELKKIGKANLFPAKYLNQKSISEADMYVVANDDDQPQTVKLIGERIAEYKNVKRKFYLYKVVYNWGEEDGEESSFLGISGPFSLDTKECFPIEMVSGIYYNNVEKLDLKKVDEYFKQYLKDME